MTGKTDAAGHTHNLLGMIDHGARVGVCLQVLVNKSSWTLLGHLCHAIDKYGKPWAVHTDNERVFTSAVFRMGLRLLGIRHQRTQLNSPWQNGRIERFWATLKPALAQLVIPGRQALQAALDDFCLYYNHVRPHSNLGGLTPVMTWNNVTHAELLVEPPKEVLWVSALDGVLQGFYCRR